MDHHNALQEEPAEHLRFAAYRSELEQVLDADEARLVSDVLTDADQPMAQSAILQHLDRRAADIYLGPAFEPWVESMTQATIRRPFLARRLQEWSILRTITFGQPWRRDALLESSDWLQLKTAAGPNTEAVSVLAKHGRTKRIRNTARTNPRQANPRSAPDQRIHTS